MKRTRTKQHHISPNWQRMWFPSPKLPSNMTDIPISHLGVAILEEHWKTYSGFWLDNENWKLFECNYRTFAKKTPLVLLPWLSNFLYNFLHLLNKAVFLIAPSYQTENPTKEIFYYSQIIEKNSKDYFFANKPKLPSMQTFWFCPFCSHLLHFQAKFWPHPHYHS